MKKRLSSVLDKLIGPSIPFEYTQAGSEVVPSYEIGQKIYEVGSYLRTHNLKGILFGSTLLNYHFNTKKKVKDLDVLLLTDYETRYKHPGRQMTGVDRFPITDRMLPNIYHRGSIKIGFNGSATTAFELDPVILQQCIERLPVGLYIPGKQVLHYLYNVYNNAMYGDVQYRINKQITELFDQGGDPGSLHPYDQLIINLIQPFINSMNNSSPNAHGYTTHVEMTEIFHTIGEWVGFENKIQTQLREALEYKKKNKKK